MDYPEKFLQAESNSPIPRPAARSARRVQGRADPREDSYGREKCVSCQLCEFVCPSKAIKVTPGAIDPSSPYAFIEKAPKDFQIDMLRCIYCGLCEEVCPEKAIVLQKEFSINGDSRAKFVRHKCQLYANGGVMPDKIMKWKKVKDTAELEGGH